MIPFYRFSGSLKLQWEWWCFVTVSMLTEWISSVFKVYHFIILYLMELLRSLVPMGLSFFWRLLFFFSLDSLRIFFWLSLILKFCYNVLMFLFSPVWCLGALSACGGSFVILVTELHSGSNISLCFYFSLSWTPVISVLTLLPSTVPTSHSYRPPRFSVGRVLKLVF